MKQFNFNKWFDKEGFELGVSKGHCEYVWNKAIKKAIKEIKKHPDVDVYDTLEKLKTL